MLPSLVAAAGYMSASVRSCDRPSRHRFCLVSLCLSISECSDGSQDCKLLLHASHAAHQDQIKTPPQFMFVMFDMYVKLPPDAGPIAVNKFYLLTLLESPLKAGSIPGSEFNVS